MFRLHQDILLAGIFLIAVSVAGPAPSHAFADETVSQLASSANQAIQSGDYDTAIKKINEAILLGDPNQPDPRLNFNKAIALYRAGDVDSARDLFSKVAGSAVPQLAAHARFNLGNVDYAQAVQNVEQDKQVAISKLKSAINHYRASLQANASDIDARANVELADRLIKQLQREEAKQKQDEQKEDQQKQNDEAKEENEKDKGDQQDENENGEEKENEQKKGESENESDKKQGDQDQQGSGDQRESKKPDSEKSKSDSEQNSDQNRKGEPSDPDKNGEQTKENGQSKDDALNDGKTEDGKDEQPSSPNDKNQPSQGAEKPPEGELKALNEQSESQGSPKPGAGMQGGSNEGLKEGQTMTMQEARKMLQAVRDRELRRRIQQLQQLRVRRVPVEKDW